MLSNVDSSSVIVNADSVVLGFDINFNCIAAFKEELKLNQMNIKKLKGVRKFWLILNQKKYLIVRNLAITNMYRY